MDQAAMEQAAMEQAAMEQVADDERPAADQEPEVEPPPAAAHLRGIAPKRPLGRPPAVAGTQYRFVAGRQRRGESSD
jgi:hypothetical protein